MSFTSGFSVNVNGHARLNRNLAKMSRANWVFDPDVKKTANEGRRDLKSTTPKDTGETAKKWSLVKKIKDSVYAVSNDKKSQDNKYLIPIILNDGRGAVFPKKAKRLYIPLSTRAKKKKLGAPIPKSFKFGVDYVLAKSAKAFKGTKFIDKSNKKMSKVLAGKLIKRIRSVHGRIS